MWTLFVHIKLLFRSIVFNSWSSLNWPISIACLMYFVSSFLTKVQFTVKQ